MAGGRAAGPAASLADAELSCTSPEMLGPDEPRWQRLVGAVRRNYWGGDCYAHGLLALGQIDVIAETTMKLWDWAALVPVVEGAGGRVTDWSGPEAATRMATGGCCRSAIRRCCRRSSRCLISLQLSDIRMAAHPRVRHARNSPPAADSASSLTSPRWADDGR